MEEINKQEIIDFIKEKEETIDEIIEKSFDLSKDEKDNINMAKLMVLSEIMLYIFDNMPSLEYINKIEDKEKRIEIRKQIILIIQEEYKYIFDIRKWI